MFRRAPLVPIVSVKSASRRGGVVLPRENFDALATARIEKVLSPFLAKLVAPLPGREDKWLPFERVDGSTHFLNRAGANGLPTLIPRFIANHHPVKKLCEYSCDVRPSPEILFKYYMRSAEQHFGRLLPDAASALGRLTPEARISICIVAASREEQGFIGRTLRCFAAQTASKASFEIVVFLNCLDSSGKVDSKSRETIAEVEHVARQNPELTIRPFFAALPDSEVWTIGRIRKLLLDAVISRVYDRQSNNREHILFTTDADGRGIHPCLVEYFLHTFDKHPHVDAIRGRVDWDWKSLTQNPLLLLGVRAMSLLDAHRRLAESDYSVGTPSLGIRVDRYMDAGGYHALDKVGEDMDLLARLKAIRSGSTVYNPILRGGPQSRVWTSLRRAEQALEIDMTPPANMWFVDGARFELEDAGVRQGPRVERGTFEDQLRSETFLPDAEKLLLKTLSTYALPHADPPVSLTDLVEVVNRYTGFEIRTGPEKNSLTVGNPDRLCSLLLYFKEHAEPYWRVQLGFEW